MNPEQPTDRTLVVQCQNCGLPWMLPESCLCCPMCGSLIVVGEIEEYEPQ